MYSGSFLLWPIWLFLKVDFRYWLRISSIFAWTLTCPPALFPSSHPPCSYKGGNVVHFRFIITNFSSTPRFGVIGQGYVGQAGKAIMEFHGNWVPVKHNVPKAYLDVWINDAEKNRPRGSVLTYQRLFQRLTTNADAYYGAVETKDRARGAVRGQLSRPFPYSLNPLTFVGADGIME